MATLLLRLQGPMQSWGTTSRFDERDTQLEPSKSGVLGLVCAALGRDRSEPLDDLASLRMGVRVDREGIPMRDYQTAKGVATAEEGKPKRERTVVSPRYFLSDAAFLVGLEGADQAFLESLQAALWSPVWPLALGRKSYTPSLPVGLPDGVQQSDLLTALKQWPALVLPVEDSLRLVLEDPHEGSMRLDQPIAPFAERRFGPRLVKQEVMHVPDTIDA
ncbi:type I-E CRISPR-associated protein Cas5/CasD [Halomonas sp. CS7]|uniref:Type I-E CRISPR-associated protein Cas5/CasD n=1 Tax=Halomonas pelophila TaxID=3151122 RepID=A0ABV1N8L0_9GAMM